MSAMKSPGSLWQDIGFGVRLLARSPGLTAVAILTLALGIGANTAIFSAINALLLNPYPFPSSDRIVVLDARHSRPKNSGTGYLDFLDWKHQNSVFSDMAIVPEIGKYTLTGAGAPRELTGGATTADFLNVLRIQPARGRFFSASEDKYGAPRVLLLTYTAWQGDFGGAENIVGRTIALDGQPFTVIGIMPRSFIFPGIETCDFLTPLRETGSAGRYQHQYEVIARMKPGVTVRQAQANMTAIAQRLAEQFPATNTGWGVAVLPLRSVMADMAGEPTAILFSAVIFVLLLACVNLAGLLIARASGRAKEIAIRLSVGASRPRVIRQLLTESVLLSIVGGAAGLLFAPWLMDALRRWAPPEFALDSALRLDMTVLAFTAAISVATGIVFGLAPAWYSSKVNLNAALKGDATSWAAARSRRRAHSILVVGQVAFSTVLLIVAGLLTRDLLAVLHMKTGLRVEHVLTFDLEPPWTKYRTDQSVVALYDDVIARLKSVPQVENAAAVGTLPMTGGMTGGSFEIEGRSKPADWVETMVEYNTVTPGYFRTMGIPLLRGRDFDERDSATSLPVAIIDSTLAREFFPRENPIGHRFRDAYDGKWRTIVGVVGSISHQQPMKPPYPCVYAPYPQKAWSGMSVVARTQGDAEKLTSIARGIVRAIDPNLIVLRMRTMRQVVADSMAEPDLLVSFVAAFAIFALLLAGIGIYGILAYSVSQRTHEMGIRMALGATRADLLKLTLRHSALLAGSGLAFGMIITFAGSRVLAALLYRISPRDMIVYSVAPLFLMTIVLIASYFPARRAMRVEPADALRYE